MKTKSFYVKKRPGQRMAVLSILYSEHDHVHVTSASCCMSSLIRTDTECDSEGLPARTADHQNCFLCRLRHASTSILADIFSPWKCVTSKGILMLRNSEMLLEKRMKPCIFFKMFLEKRMKFSVFVTQR